MRENFFVRRLPSSMSQTWWALVSSASFRLPQTSARCKRKLDVKLKRIFSFLMRTTVLAAVLCMWGYNRNRGSPSTSRALNSFAGQLALLCAQAADVQTPNVKKTIFNDLSSKTMPSSWEGGSRDAFRDLAKNSERSGREEEAQSEAGGTDLSRSTDGVDVSEIASGQGLAPSSAVFDTDGDVPQSVATQTIGNIVPKATSTNPRKSSMKRSSKSEEVFLSQLSREQPSSTAVRLPRDGSKGICFAAVGDFGLEGEAQSLVALEMDNIAGRYPVHFYVGLGDNFYPDGYKTVQDPRWSMIDSVFGKKEHLGKLPFYTILGNHDYLGDPWSQVARTYSRFAGNWTMPNYFYYVLHNYKNVPARFDTSSMKVGSFVKDWRPLVPLPREKDDGKGENLTLVVVMLDTIIQLIAAGNNDFLANATFNSKEDIDWLHGRQMEFVEEVLAAAAATADWILMVGHYPLYSDGHHGDTAELKRYLEPLIKKYKVDAYLSGHDHVLSLFRDESTETRYIVSGSASKIHEGTAVRSGTKYFESVNGFSFFVMAKDEMSTFFIEKNGAVKHVDVMQRQDRSGLASSGKTPEFPEIQLFYWQPGPAIWPGGALTSPYFWFGVLLGALIILAAREGIKIAARCHSKRKAQQYQSVIEMPGRDIP